MHTYPSKSIRQSTFIPASTTLADQGATLDHVASALLTREVWKCPAGVYIHTQPAGGGTEEEADGGVTEEEADGGLPDDKRGTKRGPSSAGRAAVKALMTAGSGKASDATGSADDGGGRGRGQASSKKSRRG